MQVLHYANEPLVCIRLSLQKLCKLAQHAETIRKNILEMSRHFDLFFYKNINDKDNIFSERGLKKALHYTLTQAAWYGRLNQQQQISQSDCKISSNCGKILKASPNLLYSQILVTTFHLKWVRQKNNNNMILNSGRNVDSVVGSNPIWDSDFF